ncbi:MAG: DUF2007 domain-containing protein [Bacteroidales bacterium]|nr:DUF2007 domain-containing protein [Bacteroidales bacterium]
MKDWIKLESFDRLHQAELRKNILEENNIPSVIINEKDSLFLFGEIELFVRKADEAKAKELIDEFRGLSKINSFVGKKQMELFRDILYKNEIHSILKKKEDSKFILDNYEVYVNNNEIERVADFLQHKLSDDWQIVKSFHRVRQTKYNTDLLDEAGIDNFIIKRKDTAYHLQKVDVYVNKNDFEKAEKLLNELNGWIKVRDYSERHWADLDEDLLNENNIKGIILKDGNKYNLLVEANNEEKAIDLINTKKDWVVVKEFSSLENANFAEQVLLKNGINSVIVNEKDSLFLIGKLELYVEVDKKEQAEEILKQL